MPDASRAENLTRPPKAISPFGPFSPHPSYDDVFSRAANLDSADVAMVSWYTKSRQEFTELSQEDLIAVLLMREQGHFKKRHDVRGVASTVPEPTSLATEPACSAASSDAATDQHAVTTEVPMQGELALVPAGEP